MNGIKSERVQKRRSEATMAVQIDEAKCTGCGSCADACSLEALAVNDGVTVADSELCVECGVCVDACPAGAMSLP